MSTAGGKCVVECPLCGCFSPSLTLHVSHLRLVHSSDRSFNIVCSIRGCAETFGAFAAYNSHVYRCHRDALGLETFSDSENAIPSTGPIGEVDGPSTPSSIVALGDNEHDTCANVHEMPPVPLSESGPTSLTTNAAKFLLHLQEGRRVSQVALTDVIDTCNALCTHVVNGFKQEV